MIGLSTIIRIHFEKDKNKSTIFSSKRKFKKASRLNIRYKDIKIKQYSKVRDLGCILNKTLSGEPMTTHIISKVISRLRLLYKKSSVSLNAFKHSLKHYCYRKGNKKE